MSQEKVELAHRMIEWFNARDAEAARPIRRLTFEIVPLSASAGASRIRGS